MQHVLFHHFALSIYASLSLGHCYSQRSQAGVVTGKGPFILGCCARATNKMGKNLFIELNV